MMNPQKEGDVSKGRCGTMMKYGEAAPVPGQVGLTRCRGYRIGLYIKFPGNKYIPTYLCTV